VTPRLGRAWALAGLLLAAATAAWAQAQPRTVLPSLAPAPPAATPSARVVCPPALPQSSAAEKAAAPRDRGLLWRATRDGRTLYLYGTLHIGKPHWHKPGPVLQAALQDSDVLALEIDPADPAVAQAMAAVPQPRQMPSALKQRLEQAFRRACVAPEAMAGLHPLLQATTLTILEARWFGMDPSFSAELALAALSRTGGRKLVALESPAVQMRALVPADEAEARRLLEQSLAQLESRSARRVLQRLARAWESGDAATLENTAAWCECTLTDAERSLMARQTDARNAALADAIVAQHSQGWRVFAAVGALHMVGTVSLPKLLQQRGFQVERVRWPER
jgi:uncharacterized protein